MRDCWSAQCRSVYNVRCQWFLRLYFIISGFSSERKRRVLCWHDKLPDTDRVNRQNIICSIAKLPNPESQPNYNPNKLGDRAWYMYRLAQSVDNNFARPISLNKRCISFLKLAVNFVQKHSMPIYKLSTSTEVSGDYTCTQYPTWGSPRPTLSSSRVVTSL